MKNWIILFSLAVVGCTTADKEIKADIAAQARNNLNFAGVSYAVKNGAVTLTGNCPSAHALTEVKQTLSGMGIIKSVTYNVGIAPVILNEFTPLKLKADSLLADYPELYIEVDEMGITLKGRILPKDKEKILASLIKQGFYSVRDSTSK